MRDVCLFFVHRGDDLFSHMIPRRASRLDVFGPGKTFRDTFECREMVYDYTCLWWGSDNEVYRNRCKEYSFNLINGEKIETTKRPCLSYCTQVAESCANRPDWMRVCDKIYCNDEAGSGMDEDCTMGPSDSGTVMCDYHFRQSTYSSANRSAALGQSILAVIMIIMMISFVDYSWPVWLFLTFLASCHSEKIPSFTMLI